MTNNICSNCGKNNALYKEYHSVRHSYQVIRLHNYEEVFHSEDDDDDYEERLICADCLRVSYNIDEQNPRINR